MLSSKNEKKRISEEDIQMREVNREATRKWWKKWWWLIALTGIGSAIVQYKVCEVTEKPVNEYGSPNTPTIADFADEIVK